jgi:hypothetical protein
MRRAEPIPGSSVAVDEGDDWSDDPARFYLAATCSGCYEVIVLLEFADGWVWCHDDLRRECAPI